MEPLKILVVDDDKDLLSTIGEILTGEGFLVTQAGNTEEACEAMDADLYDIVVSDINMDGLDGYEMATLFKDGGVKAPLVAMSGFIDPIACREAGFSMSIPKPFSRGTLLGVIQALTFRVLN